jgi:hypothetical protein
MENTIPNAGTEGSRRLSFHAILKLEGKTATGIQVPAGIVTALGASKRPPVRVTIGGYTYRTTLAAYGEVFMIPVSAEIRKNAGVSAGDELEVGIELDTEPREAVVPPDFAEALDHDADARRFFDGLSYSNKRRFVLSIEEAKTAETRQRRIDKAVSMLREGKI